MGGKGWSLEEENNLREYYPKAPKDYVLSKLLNRSWSSVKTHAHKLKIIREMHVNEHFFDSWNADMAYILGLWFADGYMRIQCGGHYISFASIDKEHLENIKNIMGITNKTGIVNRNHNGNSHTCYYFSIGNKHIYKRILELGGSPNKSLKILLPDNLPDKYFFDFLRGYFDGDGHVMLGYKDYLTLQFTSGSEKFLYQLANRIKSQIGIDASNVIPDKRENNHSHFMLYSGVKAIKIVEKMYRHTGAICLSRKKADILKGVDRDLGYRGSEA